MTVSWHVRPLDPTKRRLKITFSDFTEGKRLTDFKPIHWRALPRYHGIKLIHLFHLIDFDLSHLILVCLSVLFLIIYAHVSLFSQQIYYLCKKCITSHFQHISSKTQPNLKNYGSFVNSFEFVSDLDQLGPCSFIRLEMAALWS